MEEADLSFASLLLALRNSSDELDHKDSSRQKPSLNFHKDFYQNSSYDNECSTAAESLTTLSSYSTDIDSPMGIECVRNQQLSSIGWKRRSDPCIGIAGLVENYPFSSSSGNQNQNTSAAPVFNYSFSQLRNHGQGSFDAQIPLYRGTQSQSQEKKICRQSSSTRGTDLQSNRQQRNKAQPAELSSINESKNASKQKDEKDLIMNGGSRIKSYREQKAPSTKKNEKDAKERERERDSSKESKISPSTSGESQALGLGQSVGIDCILLSGGDVTGVGRTEEEQKEIDDTNEARLLKIARGRYKCSRCGALKTNHDCPIIEEYAGSVATQMERITLKSEEFLSGGMAGFSAVLKTCNLLTVRSNYKPHAQHPPSNCYASSCSSSSGQSKSAPTSRSSSFIAVSRSLSYNTILGANRGNVYGNDTDNNTTNSNSDNDSDSLAAKDSDNSHSTPQTHTTHQSVVDQSPRPMSDSNPHFPSPHISHTAYIPSAAGNMRSHSLPNSDSVHLAAMSAINLSSLEGRINGLNAYSLPNRNDRYPLSLRRTFGGNGDQKDPRGTAYNVTYQSLPYSGCTSGNASTVSSPREYSIPMPL